MECSRIDPELDVIEMVACQSCGGVGLIDVGDCEDGVEEMCPECNGEGLVESYE